MVKKTWLGVDELDSKTWLEFEDSGEYVYLWGYEENSKMPTILRVFKLAIKREKQNPMAHIDRMEAIMRGNI